MFVETCFICTSVEEQIKAFMIKCLTGFEFEVLERLLEDACMIGILMSESAFFICG